MRRLMHAELFRITHSGLLGWIIFVIVLFPIICICSNPDWYTYSLSENLIFWAGNLSAFLPLGIASVICAAITMSYQNRTAYYEVMIGFSIHKIIISRIFLYTTIMTAGIALVCGIYMGIIEIVGGTGSIDNISSRVMLFILVTIHICIISTIISIIGSVLTKGSLFSFMCMILRIFIVEGIFMIFSQNYIGNNSNDWFIMEQLYKVFTEKITSHIVLAIILSLEIEAVIWYICAYALLKHKPFK